MSGEVNCPRVPRVPEVNCPRVPEVNCPRVPRVSHRERELLVDARMTLLQAPQTSSIRPTELLSINDQAGTIEVGKRANLVILSINSLLDIRHRRLNDNVLPKRVIVPR
jgi:imidazolonepropionase-like amidohydrolase